MNNVDKQYFKLINYILKNGVTKKDRTGTGTISVFDYTMKFNMKDGFPLLTSKKMHWKGIVTELIWFLRGDTNIKYLVDNGCNIWVGDAYKKYKTTPIDQIEEDDSELVSASHRYLDHWSQEDFIQKIKTDDRFAKKWGELSPIYGKQWRNWGTYEKKLTTYTKPGLNSMGVSNLPECKYIEESTKGIDQFQNLINDLKNNPDSRRLMVSAWNVSDIDKMTLPPCHYGFQCYTQEINIEERIKLWCDSIGKDVSFGEDMDHDKLDSVGFPRRKLSLKVTIRSNDVFLGCPYNIASYAMLLHLLSKEVNMIPNDLIMSLGDAHIYMNHIEQCKKQLSQETYRLPTILLKNYSIDEIRVEDIKLVDYKSSPPIKGELSN